jgi:drug/metabolite transporter (DMT)-like permease
MTKKGTAEVSEGLLQIHIAVLLFGLAGLFGKWIILPATIIVLGRAFFAALFLMLFMWLKRERMFPNTQKGYKILVLLGIILAFHWVAFFQSIKLATVAIGLLTFSSFPIFTTLLAPLFFKDRIKLSDLLLAFVTFIGVAIVLPDFDFQNTYTRGFVWGILSGASFAVLSLLNKKQVATYSGRFVSLYQNGVAALVLLPFLFIEFFTFSTYKLILLVILGVVFTGISHSLFINGMKTVKAETASIIASLEPVYGILAALVLLGEVPALNEIIGGIIILSATVMATVLSFRS